MHPHIVDLAGSAWQLRGYLGEEWRTLDLSLQVRADHPDWLPATIPGAVVADLDAAGLVADPYEGRNSLAVEWVRDRAWIYRREVELPLDEDEPRDGAARVQLYLDGLETPAHVYVDGRLVGDHDAPSLPSRLDLTDALRGPGRHVLAVVLEPSPREQSQMGRTSLVTRHRGRMRAGWDFCPRFPEAGIGGAQLRLTGAARIEAVAIRPHLDEDLRHASVELGATLDAPAGDVEIRWTIEAADGEEVASTGWLEAADPSALRPTFEIDRPNVWWANGLGGQPLHRATAEVRAGGRTSDRWSGSFGLRRVALVANAGAPERALPYTLEVNGRPTYLRGWNWVPDDVSPGVARPGRLRRLLELARDSGANLLRVWGGGRIESDEFYDECDRLGLLVWQEFLLSSSCLDNEPSEDAMYLGSVAAEAGAIVRSRSNHPSLAMWCGGNELSVGPERRPLDEAASPVLRILRDAVRREDPDRAWLPTSPSGPLFMRDDPGGEHQPILLHDVHGPWHHRGLGRQEELVETAAPLLHSEFGAGSLANLETLEATVPTAARLPLSRHNPTYRHRGSSWICDGLVRETFAGARRSPAESLEGLEWASQYLQAGALRGWIEANRRRWPHNSGSIPWQLDEPYPSAFGTCVVDWFGRPKAAYWAVRRAYAPVLLSARVIREAWGGRECFEAELWVTAEGGAPVCGDLDAQLLTADGWSIASLRRRIEVPLGERAGGSALVGFLAAPLERVAGGVFALDLALRDGGGNAVATNRYLLTAAETLAPIADLPEPRLEAVASLSSGCSGIASIVNTGRSLAPLVRLSRLTDPAGRPLLPEGALPDDDCFSLLPGERRVLRVRRADSVTSARVRAVRPMESETRPAVLARG